LAERAVVLNPHVAKYHRQLAEAIGVKAEHAGPFQQLLLARRFRKEIDNAIDLDSKDIQARRDLLEFYLIAPSIAGGDFRKATGLAEQISALDAPAGFLAKARIASHKNTAEAELLLQKAAQAQPSSYKAQIELARFYLAGQRLDREAAERAARHALDLDRSR